MKRCSSCQRLAANRFQYCPSCGAKFPDAEPPQREEDFTVSIDFRDWELPEEAAGEAAPPRRPLLSDSALRLLLCARSRLFFCSPRSLLSSCC